MKYIRKPETVEATQVSVDFTHDGTLIPAGHWLVVHEDGKAHEDSDEDFAANYVEAPPEAPVEPAEPAVVEVSPLPQPLAPVAPEGPVG